MTPAAADLSGSRVLVTGASRGYGAAIARELARHGAHVLLTATRGARLASVASACRDAGALCDEVEMDLGSPESVDAAAAQARHHLLEVALGDGLAGRDLAHLQPFAAASHIRQLHQGQQAIGGFGAESQAGSAVLRSVWHSNHGKRVGNRCWPVGWRWAPLRLLLGQGLLLV